MRTRIRGLLMLLSLLPVSCILSAQQPAAVQIAGKGIQSVQITEADLKKMARLSVDVQNAHTKAADHYEGVRLSDLLTKAGVPLGEKLRGRALATYVVVQASDGYAVVFSMAEIDPAMNNNRIILADTMNGKPLGEHEGPLKIVAPGDNRPARWVRMVNALRVESGINPSESSPQ